MLKVNAKSGQHTVNAKSGQQLREAKLWLYLATIGKIEANEDNGGSVIANGSDDRVSGEAAKSRSQSPPANHRAYRGAS